MTTQQIRTITGHKGRWITVELKAPSTSGYSWSPSYDDSKITLIGSRRKANLQRMGAQTTEIFRFRALVTGKTKIHFELVRPWEKNPLETRDVEVSVLR